MDLDLIIKGGTLVTAGETVVTDLGVLEGRIVALGPELLGARVVDARGLLVLPGAVDPHVHLEMPAGQTSSSDTWETGTRAAACGGTTTVIDFVEPEGEEGLLEAFQSRRSLADSQAAIDFSLHMTLTAADQETLVQIPGVVAAGITSFKTYTTYEGFRLTDPEFLAACQAVQAAGGMVLVHAENDAIVKDRTRALLAAGEIGPSAHPRSRPGVAEAEAVSRVPGPGGKCGGPIVYRSCLNSPWGRGGSPRPKPWPGCLRRDLSPISIADRSRLRSPGL